MNAITSAVAVFALLITFVLFPFVETAGQAKHSYRRVFRSEGGIAGYSLSGPVSVKLQCAAACTAWDPCRGYGVTTADSGGRHCWLYDHPVAYRRKGATPSSAQYFWRLSPHCPAAKNYTLALGICYKVYTETKSHKDAEDACARDDGHLAVADTTERLRLLTGSRSGFFPWLGLSDDEKEGEWWWADGRPLPLASSLWERNAPDNSGGRENFAIAKYGNIGDFGGWYRRPFACQVPLL